MSTIARLNRMQRCKYLSPERWISGELVFRNPKAGSLEHHNPSVYNEILSEWLSKNNSKQKQDLR